MTYGDELERLLRELNPPRRNHYFYGKLMDVCHFEMEQTYVNHKRWLLNQQALGAGVLCGLRVAAENAVLYVEPGMAIDGYGREIIKPVRSCIDPWMITDPCGQPRSALSKDDRHRVTLLLCYKECLTDYMPVLVSDCGDQEDAAAGTTVETFTLAVREGVPAAAGAALDPRCCRALAAGRDQGSGTEPAPPEGERPAASALGPKGPHLPGPELPPAEPDLSPLERIRRQLCECAAAVCRTPAEACVVLAVVELLPGGRIGAIEQCRYRQRIYSNQVLLDLILCLATRLDECCREREQPQAPPKVAAVQVLDIDGDVLAVAEDPEAILAFPYQQFVHSLRIAFTQPVERSTVVAGGAGDDPDRQSFLVIEAEHGLVPGRLAFEDPKTVRWDTEADAAPVGRYWLRLFGDADPGIGRPAITSADGVPLDGEPIGLPSGDDTPGGVFELRFDIAGEVGAEAPPKVAAVYVLSSQNVVLAYITDPRQLAAVDAANQPKSIRINFTTAIDPTTLVASGADAPQLNVRVTEAGQGLIPGTLRVEGPDQVFWTADVAAALPPGTYLLRLFGDADRQAGRPAIAGVNGLRLDGESDRPLPSGDGAEGGMFRLSFTITGEATGGDRP